MSKEIDDGGYVYPSDIGEHISGCHFGMTRRQWLAGMAMQALINKTDLGESNLIPKEKWDTVSRSSYGYADSMIAYEKNDRAKYV